MVKTGFIIALNNVWFQGNNFHVHVQIKSFHNNKWHRYYLFNDIVVKLGHYAQKCQTLEILQTKYIGVKNLPTKFYSQYQRMIGLKRIPKVLNNASKQRPHTLNKRYKKWQKELLLLNDRKPKYYDGWVYSSVY